jgi:quercetin dioxygenase-like cupin family protein
MEIRNVPFQVADWNKVPKVEHPGVSGTSFWRTLEMGNIRVRFVEYSAGYRSDHWCERGHVLLVLEGELTIELKDGREFRLVRGMSFQAADDASNPHLPLTKNGATVFIVD